MRRAALLIALLATGCGCDVNGSDPGAELSLATEWSLTLGGLASGDTVTGSRTLVASISGPSAVTKVNWRIDGVQRCQDHWSPWSIPCDRGEPVAYDFAGLANGPHTFRVEAFHRPAHSDVFAAGWNFPFTLTLTTPAPTPSPPPPPPPAVEVPEFGTGNVLVAAGDIARCIERDTVDVAGNQRPNVADPPYDGDEQTAGRIGTINPGVVLALGDNAYPYGLTEDFQTCYEPSWGALKSRTKAAVGNHEIAVDREADPHFDYYGEHAGPPGKGWHAFRFAGTLFAILNSNCVYNNPDDGTGEFPACGAGSDQLAWLRNVLEADRRAGGVCQVLALHHAPRTSDARGYEPHWHHDAAKLDTILELAQEYAVDALLGAHAHIYERTHPLVGATWTRDDATGIRHFVVGTGGTPPGIGVAWAAPHVAKSIRNKVGVLRLDLKPTGYDWRFKTPDGATWDSGSGTCR